MIFPPAPYSYTGEVTSVDTPTLSGVYTYDGNEQTSVWTNYDENAISIYGQTSGINAGEYEVTFSLNSKRAYQWSDGTKADKTGTWSIGKASNIITFNPSVLFVTYYDRDATSTIDYFEDGELSYFIDNDNITATLDQINKTVTAHAKTTGSSSITVNVAESANYLPASASINVAIDMTRNLTITVNSSDNDMGITSGGGTVKEGNSITVTATANTGYKFTGWEENGEIVSTETNYTFIPIDDVTLIALFDKQDEYISGADWFPINMPSIARRIDICYGNDKFVAIQYNSSEVSYSLNGLEWQDTAMPESMYLMSVIYGEDKFVAIGGQDAAYSTDGIIWTKSSLPYSNTSWRSVAYGSNKFIGIGGGYSGDYSRIAYSRDGVTWSSSVYYLPSYADWRGIAYGDNKFVAVAYNSNKAAYSGISGTNWQATTLPSIANWCDITYGGNKFVTIADGSNKAAYSPDGINWTEIILPSTANWRDITYGNGKFVAIARGADSNMVAYSEDGINWKSSTLPSYADWRGIAYGDNKFVAVAYNSNKAAYSNY